MKHRLIFFFVVVLVLAGCSSTANISLNLTPEEKANYEQVLAEYTEKLKNWNHGAPKIQKESSEEPEKPAETTTTSTEVETSYTESEGLQVKGVTVETVEVTDPRPPFDYFLQIALAQENLGYPKAALKTYKQAMRLYENSEVAWNNMGRLYEQFKKYDTAIKYYQKIIDQFGFKGYYLDIATAYVRKGDPKAAQKAYDEFRLLTNRADTALELQISQLKDKLKNESNGL